MKPMCIPCEIAGISREAVTTINGIPLCQEHLDIYNEEVKGYGDSKIESIPTDTWELPGSEGDRYL